MALNEASKRLPPATKAYGGRERSSEPTPEIAAEDKRRQSKPTQAVEGQALRQQIGRQQQSGDAEANRGNIPWRQAGAKAKTGDNDVTSPDAHGGEAAKSPTCVS